MYSCPPTSGMRARLRIETLARPPPCSGNHPSVLSSRVITCARTFTSESLKKRRKKVEGDVKGRRSKWGHRCRHQRDAGSINFTYSSHSSVMILWEVSELNRSRWHGIQHFYELQTSRRASIELSCVFHNFALLHIRRGGFPLNLLLLVSSTETVKKSISAFSPFFRTFFFLNSSYHFSRLLNLKLHVESFRLVLQLSNEPGT